MVALAGTPKKIVFKLADAEKAALNDPETIRQVREEGAEIMWMSPDKFTRFLVEEVNRDTKLVAEIGMQKED